MIIIFNIFLKKIFCFEKKKIGEKQIAGMILGARFRPGDAPVIAVTANAFDEAVKRCLEAGMIVCFTRSFPKICRKNVVKSRKSSAKASEKSL